jgi:Uma2 family endonuclease
LILLSDDGIVVVRFHHNDEITRWEVAMTLKMTTDEYLAGPEAMVRRELVWGVVREPPSPFRKHQGVVTRATVLLSEHVLDHGLGQVYVSPLDVVFDRQKALVLQPDVMFVSRERSAILNDFVEGPPDLVAEVISEGSQHYDRVSKLEWYRNYHVREYWVIDPEVQEIEVIRLDIEPLQRNTYRGSDAIRSVVLPDFEEIAAGFFTVG